jgi:hypothetical protein
VEEMQGIIAAAKLALVGQQREYKRLIDAATKRVLEAEGNITMSEWDSLQNIFKGAATGYFETLVGLHKLYLSGALRDIEDAKLDAEEAEAAEDKE